jgi:regulation of enolase protein 1 (concanavalin A-like superfamily)
VQWQRLRLASLKPAPEWQAGIMCGSPKREGFDLAFRDFESGSTARCTAELSQFQRFGSPCRPATAAV